MSSIMESTIEQKTDTANDVHWLIDGMFPVGYKGMVASCEGGCKTTLLSWIALRVAVGLPIFDMEVKKGNVLMIDEETPIGSLKNKLNRFALSMGIEDINKIPTLYIESMQGFRFGRKNTELLKEIAEIKPALITIDTLLACLPSGRQSLGENNAETGIEVRDGLNDMLKAAPNCSVLMAAHSGKSVMYFDLDDYKQSEMQALVRGHGSIVGEACDAGYGLKKVSETPLRFVLIPKARRLALPMGNIFVEMQEKAHGEGWARLVLTAPVPLPPSNAAVDLLSLFLREGNIELTAKEISQTASGVYERSEIRLGLNQLKKNGIIVNTSDSFNFKLNPSESGMNKDYLEQSLALIGKNIE